MGIPFFLNRPFTVSFSRFLYTNRATYENIVGYAKRRCHDYRNIYLVLRHRRGNEDQWRFSYGEFFADIAFGHMEKYPDVVLVQQLRDGSIFQIVCR